MTHNTITGVRTTTAAALAGALLLGGGMTGPASAKGSATTQVWGPPQTARVDVDGDGRRDTVTVGRMTQKTVRVTVRTAKGRTATLLMGRGHLAETTIVDRPYRGAADLDGVRGKDLLITLGWGVHTAWQKAVTWRNGKLVILRAPGWNDGWWTPDSAMYGGLGYFASGSVARRRLTVIRSDCTTKRCVATSTTHAWRRGAWTPISTRKFTYAPERMGRYTWWHVSGVARD